MCIEEPERVRHVLSFRHILSIIRTYCVVESWSIFAVYNLKHDTKSSHVPSQIVASLQAILFLRPCFMIRARIQCCVFYVYMVFGPITIMTIVGPSLIPPEAENLRGGAKGPMKIPSCCPHSNPVGLAIQKWHGIIVAMFVKPRVYKSRKTQLKLEAIHCCSHLRSSSRQGPKGRTYVSTRACITPRSA